MADGRGSGRRGFECECGGVIGVSRTLPVKDGVLVRYRGCQHCDGCLRTGQCVVQDDMQKLYPKLREMDALVFATPVFFMGPSSQASRGAAFIRSYTPRASWGVGCLSTIVASPLA